MTISKHKAWNLTERYIEDIIKSTPNAFELGLKPHLKKCIEWGLVINPWARYSLKIALYGHDIERAFPDRIKCENLRRDSPEYKEYKKQHSLNSAKKLVDFLKKINAEEPMAQEVETLVKYHDVGYVQGLNQNEKGYLAGFDERLYRDLRLLRDADAISLFDDPETIEMYILKYGIKDTEDKIKKFMFDKLTKKACQKPEVMAIYKKAEKLIEEKKAIIKSSEFL